MTQQRIKRIYHTWDKWECYPSGFYEAKHPTMSKEECLVFYAEFLRDKKRFSDALRLLTSKWKNSCEHYLTNEKMNRIAWLGQAAACYDSSVPACYRAGYFRLTEQEQFTANLVALTWLNVWLINNNYDPVDLIGAGIKAHADIY